jgi:hypothetical protein
MTVPKAPVYLYYGVETRENYIRLTGQLFDVKAIPITGGMK